jgi:hypothetical protein
MKPLNLLDLLDKKSPFYPFTKDEFFRHFKDSPWGRFKEKEKERRKLIKTLEKQREKEEQEKKQQEKEKRK